MALVEQVFVAVDRGKASAVAIEAPKVTAQWVQAAVKVVDQEAV